MQLFDLTGKLALITGGANGMGRMIAEGLTAAGARVIVTSRKGDEAAAAAAAIGGGATGLAADLSRPEGAGDLAAALLARDEPLSILINNAGRTWGAPLEQFPDKAWAPVMAVNVQAPFTLVRDLLPLLRRAAEPADPARVINIGSVAGARVEPLPAYSYAASKAAIQHLSRQLAADLAGDAITVNTILPGYFPTQMTAHIRADDAASDDLLQHIPLGRLGSASDIAGACIFLATVSFMESGLPISDGFCIARWRW